jgi:exonuclease VII small subunit
MIPWLPTMRCALTFSLAVLLAAVTIQSKIALGQPGLDRIPAETQAEPVPTPGMTLIGPIAIDGKESELMRLLKLRHNTALDESRARVRLFMKGRVAMDEILQAQMRLSKAGIDLVQSQAEKLKYYQLVFEWAKLIEDIIRDKYEQGSEPVQTMQRAIRQRLSAQINLMRFTQGELNAVTDSTKQVARGDVLHSLLKERFEAAEMETDAWVALFEGGRVPLDDVIKAMEQRGPAGVEMAKTTDERLKHLGDWLEHSKNVEAIVRVKFEANSEPPQMMHYATYSRLDAEVALARARQIANSSATAVKMVANRSTNHAQSLGLLMARYKAASDEVAALLPLFEGGRVAIDDVLESIYRRSIAGVEVARTPAARLKYLQNTLRAAKEVEAVVRGKFDQGSEPPQQMNRATYDRLEVEIALVRACGKPTPAAESTAAEALMPDDHGRLPMRQWSDNSGQFRVTACLSLILDGKVRLLKESGRTTTVPTERLSDLDQQYVVDVVEIYGTGLTMFPGRGPLER